MWWQICLKSKHRELEGRLTLSSAEIAKLKTFLSEAGLEVQRSHEEIRKLNHEIVELQNHTKELDEAIAEYHEIIETGWEYPDTTVRLPKSRDIIARTAIEKQPSEQGKYRLVIESLPDFWIADIADTLSEDPFYGMGHNLVLIKLPQPNAPYRYEDLAVGDSAIYQLGERFITHQIVKIEKDEQGRKYTFRGRNTTREDPYIIRDIDIKYLTVGIIF